MKFKFQKPFAIDSYFVSANYMRVIALFDTEWEKTKR